MKKTGLIVLCWLIAVGISLPAVYAQGGKNIRFVEAASLNLIGKAMPTPFPYHRVDTVVYKGMTRSENQQARCTAGLAIVFKTNSSFIDLHPTYKWEHRKDNVTGISTGGFDLYIKRDNKWVFAGTGVSPVRDSVFTIVAGMDASEKECLLYLPIYSELAGLKIGIQSNASISSIPNPFKTKTVFFGSSFTQGTSSSRPGMSYPMQIQRRLNLDVCNLGFSGNSKLQPYFGKVLADIDADAIVMDAFSNPDEKMIRERLLPFADIVAPKHPDIPVIFVETIHRGNINFNLKAREKEAAKRKAAQELMAQVQKKYKNVYFISNPLPEDVSDDTSADGVHPSDLGYYKWAERLGTKLAEILRKYEK